MLSSPEEANRIFSKWRQESRKVRFMVSGPPVRFIGTAQVESFDFDFLILFALDNNFTLAVELDGADFEYLEPRDADLSTIGMTSDACVCCLSIAIDGEKRLLREPLGVVRLLLCELIDKELPPP